MIIYSKTWGLISKNQITRVTEKQAIIKINDRSEIRFDREVGDGSYFHARGSSGYDRTSYSIETPEIKAGYEHQSAVSAFKKINTEKLTQDQLSRILLIAEETSP